MAGRAGNGLRLDLSRIPIRESGMTPYEMMLSESQERMLLVATQGPRGGREEGLPEVGPRSGRGSARSSTAGD